MHHTATMCRVLGVSASGYYARQKRPPSARARADGELSAQIAAIHQCSRATYGAPRIHEELLAAGIHVGRKRVARLMKATGLSGVSRQRWVTTTVRDTNAHPAPDLVERNFSASGPNRLWVVHPDLDRLSLSRRSARCVQPTHRGLGDGDLSAYRAGPPGAQHGPRPAPPWRRDPSFRSWQPVYFVRLR